MRELAPRLALAPDPAPVTVRSFTTFEDLEPLAAGWDRLVLTASRPSPYLLFPWARAWWREYGSGSELAVHAAFRGNDLVGVIPAFVRRSARLRVLRFLGDYRSMLADVLLAPGEDVATARILLRAAQAQADYSALFGLGAGSNVEAVSPALTLHERNEAPVVLLDRDWCEVERAKLGASTRSKFRAKRRKLAQLGEVTVSVATTPAQIMVTTPESFRIHALRWRGRPDVSGVATARAQRFYAAAYRALAERHPGVFRIATLNVGGEAVAYHAHSVIRDRMYVHRLGFDPALARFSPGLLLILDVLERACAEGVSVVELLGPAEAYKEPFADEFRPLREGIGDARTAKGHAAAAVHSAAIRIRGRLKKTRLRDSYVSLRATLASARR